MIETWGESYGSRTIVTYTVKFDDNFTGVLKVHEINKRSGLNILNKFDPILNQPFPLSNSHKFIILQEVEEKYLYFFTKKRFVPLILHKEYVSEPSYFTTVGAMSFDRAKEKLKEVQKEYKSTLREIRLNKILSKK